jgi:mono/diheme cytochrome c family protein
MKLTTPAAALLVVAGTAVPGAALVARAANGPQRGLPSSAPSASTGVFTSTQEGRGAEVYNRECSTCHGERLKGGEGAPALSGSEFAAAWNGRTVGDLFNRIRQTMPAAPEQPGKLSSQQYVDVVAHILSVNGFPSGPAELPSEIDLLERIRIDGAKP